MVTNHCPREHTTHSLPSPQDFIGALGYLLMVTLKVGPASTKNPWACNSLALVTIFFPGASFIATDGIALYAYLTLVHPSFRHSSRCQDSRRTIYAFVAACLIIPGIVTGTIAGLNVEGYDKDFFTDTCWIKNQTGPDASAKTFEYQVLGGKAVEWLSFVFVLCCYVPTVRKLHSVLRHNVSRQSKDIRRMLFRLALVPGIFILLRVPSALHTLLMYILQTPTYKGYQTMVAMQAIGDTGQGAANGMLYVVCSDTVHRVFFGGCCFASSDNDEEIEYRELSEAQSSIGATNPSDRLMQSQHEYYETGEPLYDDNENAADLGVSSFDEESV
jgi:hypothetical protein